MSLWICLKCNVLTAWNPTLTCNGCGGQLYMAPPMTFTPLQSSTKTVKSAERPSRMRWAWIAWLLMFLLLEIPAAVNKRSGDTLSETVWSWLPDWRLWGLIAGLLLSLIGHLSPAHLTVVPVGIFGAAFMARIGWVEWKRRRA